MANYNPPWNTGTDTAKSPTYMRRRERDGGRAFGGTSEYHRKRAAVFARDGGCVWCGTTDDLRLDHIIERRERPDHSLSNLQALCQPCHVAKTRAYTEALMRLREAHEAEFAWLLEGCYAEALDDMPDRSAQPDPQISLW